MGLSDFPSSPRRTLSVEVLFIVHHLQSSEPQPTKLRHPLHPSTPILRYLQYLSCSPRYPRPPLAGLFMVPRIFVYQFYHRLPYGICQRGLAN